MRGFCLGGMVLVGRILFLRCGGIGLRMWLRPFIGLLLVGLRCTPRFALSLS